MTAEQNDKPRSVREATSQKGQWIPIDVFLSYVEARREKQHGLSDSGRQGLSQVMSTREAPARHHPVTGRGVQSGGFARFAQDTRRIKNAPR